MCGAISLNEVWVVGHDLRFYRSRRAVLRTTERLNANNLCEWSVREVGGGNGVFFWRKLDHEMNAIQWSESKSWMECDAERPQYRKRKCRRRGRTNGDGSPDDNGNADGLVELRINVMSDAWWLAINSNHKTLMSQSATFNPIDHLPPSVFHQTHSKYLLFHQIDYMQIAHAAKRIALWQQSWLMLHERKYRESCKVQFNGVQLFNRTERNNPSVKHAAPFLTCKNALEHLN